MNSPTSPSFAGSFANALPKLGLLTLLIVWGTQGGQIPVARLGVILGGLAMMEGLTAAALEKQRLVLGWADLPSLLRCLFGPAALPLYALSAAGMIFFGSEADQGRRITPVSPPERSLLTPRSVPGPRPGSSSITPPPGFATRPGTPSAPAVNLAPKGQPTAGAVPRPTFATPPRPVPTTPPAAAKAPTMPRPPTPTPATLSPPAPASPTATAAPAAPSSASPRQ